MDKFQVEIYFSSKNDDNFITIESFLTLFVYNYLNCPKNIEIIYIKRDLLDDENKEICKLRLNSEFIINSDDNYIMKNCKNINKRLPMYEKENLFISGVCAICRAIVLQAGNRDDLLGFKKSCLLAPSEKSIWTKLCEIDMIEAIKNLLNLNCNQENEFTELKLSNCFEIFENHMGQPTRAHNFYKILRENVKKSEQKNIKNKRNENSVTLEHNYAEGYFFSLVDVILYPCIYILFLKLSNEQIFEQYFPLTLKWLQRIDKLDKNLYKTFEKIIDIKYFKQIRLSKSIFQLKFISIGGDIKSKVTPHSLYRNDVKKCTQDKIFTNQTHIEDCLIKVSQLNLNIKSIPTVPDDLKFNWDEIPVMARPEFGGLPEERLLRKKHQLRNLTNAVCDIAKPNDVIVDFCSGTGHLGIILAASLPQCHVIFLENKSISILKAKERVEKLNLKNCSFYQSNIDYFERKFDIGVSLHACGTATDIVIWKCLQINANFICCPCCYGSISPMPHIRYPLSRKYQEKIKENEYLYIAHAADQSHDITVKNCNLEKREQGELCMDVIDTDRKCLAEEMNYEVQLKKLYPEDCTPKNRLLIGIKKNNKNMI